MAETLVIVESPAKAKTIGKFLGAKYKVVASNGHVRDLPKSQLGVDVEHSFTPKYITLRGRGDVLEAIRREAKAAKKIYLATDPDMEGEAISWHLAQILKMDLSSKCRIEFNEITAGTVKNSVKAARAIDMNLVDAQQARRVLDRLVGYKISPILWAKVRRGLSAGRVQSVACRILCDREKEIMDFIPEEFWNITAQLKHKDSRKPLAAKFYGYGDKKTEIHTEAEAQAVLDASQGGPFEVTDIKVSERVRHAPPPFTTSSLQQEASRKLGFTTKLTMLVAQQLYEGVEIAGQGVTGLITYIRTDSVRVADEAQKQALAYIGEAYGEQYVPPKPNIYKGRKGAQDAHEAIRPASIFNKPQELKASLNNNQYKLYKLIFERFLASQMSEAQYEVSSVSFGANGCTYKAAGTRTLFNGYTTVYTEGKDEAEEAETTLPKLTVGEKLNAESVDKEQKFTQPPARYTEASLVKTLEEKGIGRPSTYAPTISTIIDRGYVQREKKQLIPTELGFVVTQLMKENFKDIVDVKFTADMESKLDKVKDGEQEWTEIIQEFYGPFEETVVKASESIEKIVIADEVSDIPCEQCGAMMVYKMGRFGKFLACPKFPECRNTKAIVEKIDVPCPTCGASLIKRKSKRGKVFYGCERYPDCSFVSWDRPAKERCPQCGALMVYKMGQNGGYTVCTDKACGHVVRPQKRKKTRMNNPVPVIGAGLAGCEAAFQLAERGLPVYLYEMKPLRRQSAHTADTFAELVCSNSLRSDRLQNGAGLMKEEMRRLNSLILWAADQTRVPAGGALAVDREGFTRLVTERIESHPNIEVVHEEAMELPQGMGIVATGPLTDGPLWESIQALFGPGLHFYDAAAPVVTAESLDMDKVFRASRYERGSDYLNCPMSRKEYFDFTRELVQAETAPLREFETPRVFEGCMPVEVMAKRGEMTLAFGPLKPVGLTDERTGKRPFAVVQLRQDDAAGSLYNLVGFQTNLRFGEQRRVFGMIPGLEQAEFVRYGVMHRNTFLPSPGKLDWRYRVMERPGLYFAGQITGVEGYVESAGSGLVAGINLAHELLGKEPVDFTSQTALGAMAHYVSEYCGSDFQPMNINFGIMENLPGAPRNKTARYTAIAERALLVINGIIANKL